MTKNTASDFLLEVWLITFLAQKNWRKTCSLNVDEIGLKGLKHSAQQKCLCCLQHSYKQMQLKFLKDINKKSLN
jgi:hypothetical protein